MSGRPLPQQCGDMHPTGHRNVFCVLVELLLMSLEALLRCVDDHPEFLPEKSSSMPNDIHMPISFVERPFSRLIPLGHRTLWLGYYIGGFWGKFSNRYHGGGRGLRKGYFSCMRNPSKKAPLLLLQLPCRSRHSCSQQCLWPCQHSWGSGSQHVKWCPWLCLHMVISNSSTTTSWADYSCPRHTHSYFFRGADLQYYLQCAFFQVEVNINQSAREK